LPALVAALERQTLPTDQFDVVIIDDGSTDDTYAVLQELAARTPLDMRIVRNDRNRGPAYARNAGWRTSDAAVIAFTDDDCAPMPRWLEGGLAAMQGSIGVVQGRTIPDPSAPQEAWTVSQRIESFDDRYETCNIFYRTDVMRAAGGFDESMPFFGEDTVLGWTTRRMGIASAFAPEALVHHAVTKPGFAYHRRWAMQHGNWATLIKRFPEMRREVLWLNLFTKRRHAALLAAVTGVAMGTVWRPAFLLALPYVLHVRPHSLNPDELRDRLLGAPFDAAVVTGLLRGSLRERTLVL